MTQGSEEATEERRPEPVKFRVRRGAEHTTEKKKRQERINKL